MKQQKNNIFAIDGLRTLCILAVVLIHSVTRILERTGYTLSQHQAALFLDGLGRYAVPLFFLISGFVLSLHYHLHESFLHFLAKRFNRVLIPYVFWSLFYYFFVYANNSDGIFHSLLTGSASYQLYFIPAVLILYLIFPILFAIRKLLGKPLVLLILGGLEVYFLYNDYFIRHYTFFMPLNIVLLNYFFFIVGMVAAKHHEYLVDHIKKYLFILLPVTFILPFYFYNQSISLYYKTYDIGKFYSSWRPDVFFYTLTFAAVFYYFFTKFNIGHRLFKKLSNLSFFVYFVHTLILELVWYRAGVRLINIDPSGLILFTAVTFISFLTAYFAHKVKYLSRVTG